MFLTPLNILIIIFTIIYTIVQIIKLSKKEDKKWGKWIKDFNYGNDKLKHFGVNLACFIIVFFIYVFTNPIIKIIFRQKYLRYDYNFIDGIISSLLCCFIISIGREIYDWSPLKEPKERRNASVGDLIADSLGILFGFLFIFIFNKNIPIERYTTDLQVKLLGDIPIALRQPS